jgi:hypothetical protein
VDAAELDAHDPADARFFGALQLEGASIVRPPSLAVLEGRSTVAVLATVVDVRPSRVLHGTGVLAVVLRPQQVISGRLQAAGDIRVETLSLGPRSPGSQAAGLRAALPRGTFLWFLRWQGAPLPATKPGAPAIQGSSDPHLYALSHPYAVVGQGSRGVVALLAEKDSPAVGFLRELRPYRTMSSLVRRLD